MLVLQSRCQWQLVQDNNYHFICQSWWSLKTISNAVSLWKQTLRVQVQEIHNKHQYHYTSNSNNILPWKTVSTAWYLECMGSRSYTLGLNTTFLDRPTRHIVHLLIAQRLNLITIMTNDGKDDPYAHGTSSSNGGAASATDTILGHPTTHNGTILSCHWFRRKNDTFDQTLSAMHAFFSAAYQDAVHSRICQWVQTVCNCFHRLLENETSEHTTPQRLNSVRDSRLWPTGVMSRIVRRRVRGRVLL